MDGDALVKALQSMTPKVIEYPVMKTGKAVINILVNRKRASSIGRVLAVICGIVAGVFWPQIGAISSFFISSTPGLTDFAVIMTSGLGIAASILITSILLMYLMKRAFRYYYSITLTDTNPEYRITKADQQRLLTKTRFSLYAHDPTKLNQMFLALNKRVNELRKRILKLKEQADEPEHLAEIKRLKQIVIKLKNGSVHEYKEWRDADVQKQEASKIELKKALMQLDPTLIISPNRSPSTTSELPQFPGSASGPFPGSASGQFPSSASGNIEHPVVPRASVVLQSPPPVRPKQSRVHTLMPASTSLDEGLRRRQNTVMAHSATVLESPLGSPPAITADEHIEKALTVPETPVETPVEQLRKLCILWQVAPKKQVKKASAQELRQLADGYLQQTPSPEHERIHNNM